MQCRIPPAASSTSCLWITDQVLDEACARFLRASKAQQYYAKRFRSNAPGPLEARRRTTRRRMGLEAAAGGGGPPPFDMGALFGLGVKPGQDMEKGMRWERPELPSVRQRPGNTWMPVLQRSSGKKYASDQQLVRFFDVPADPVAKSKAGFEALLARVSGVAEINIADIQPLLAYLGSHENEPEARLTARLLQWLRERTVSTTCWDPLVKTVRQKLALRTILDSETEAILLAMHEQKAEDKYFAVVVGSLTRDLVTKMFQGVTRHIVSSATAPDRLQSTLNWLTRVRGCLAVVDDERLSDMVLDGVHAELSDNFFPSELATHFSELRRIAVAQALLQHWAAKLARHDLDPSVMHNSAQSRIRYNQAAMDDVDISVLKQELHNCRERQSPSGRRPHSWKSLVDVIQVLADRRLPYRTLQAEIVSIYSQTEPSTKVRNLLLECTRRSSIDVAPDLAMSVIHTLTDTEHFDDALRLFEAMPTVPLSGHYDLPQTLAQSTGMTASKMFMLLNRLTVDDTLPLDAREIRTNPLTQEHVDTVHLVAYAYAKAPHLTSRMAFRRVWECYRFLKDRSAPLDPLISRAFVKAGISRPLAEGKRPSATQTAYILHIVRSLEGEDLAWQLDKLVFDLGKQIARNDAMGVSSPAAVQMYQQRHRSDSVLLWVIRNRVRHWRKRQWALNRPRVQPRNRARDRYHRACNGGKDEALQPAIDVAGEAIVHAACGNSVADASRELESAPPVRFEIDAAFDAGEHLYLPDLQSLSYEPPSMDLTGPDERHPHAETTRTGMRDYGLGGPSSLERVPNQTAARCEPLAECEKATTGFDGAHDHNAAAGDRLGNSDTPTSSRQAAHTVISEPHAIEAAESFGRMHLDHGAYVSPVARDVWSSKLVRAVGTSSRLSSVSVDRASVGPTIAAKTSSFSPMQVDESSTGRSAEQDGVLSGQQCVLKVDDMRPDHFELADDTLSPVQDPLGDGDARVGPFDRASAVDGAQSPTEGEPKDDIPTSSDYFDSFGKSSTTRTRRRAFAQEGDKDYDDDTHAQATTRPPKPPKIVWRPSLSDSTGTASVSVPIGPHPHPRTTSIAAAATAPNPPSPAFHLMTSQQSGEGLSARDLMRQDYKAQERLGQVVNSGHWSAFAMGFAASRAERKRVERVSRRRKME